MNAKEYLEDCKAKLVAEQTRQINQKVQEKAGEIATRQAEAERLRVEKVKELDVELNEKVNLAKQRYDSEVANARKEHDEAVAEYNKKVEDKKLEIREEIVSKAKLEIDPTLDVAIAQLNCDIAKLGQCYYMWELLLEFLENFIKPIIEIFNFLINNYGWVYTIMVALIVGILELIKLPYKHFTKKIKNEVVRKLLNKVIILFSFVISFLLYYFGHIILPKYISCDTVAILGSAMFSNVIYALGDGVINGNSAKKLVNAVVELDSDKDGKVSAKEAKEAMKKFDDELDNI